MKLKQVKEVGVDFPFRDKPFRVFDVGNWLGLVGGVVVLGVAYSLAKPVKGIITNIFGGAVEAGKDLLE